MSPKRPKRVRASARGPSSARAAARIGERLAEGLALHRQGRLAEARTCYEKVLARDPSHADALHFLGLICHQAGEGGRAAVLLRQAVAARPEIAAFHLNLGNVLSETGDAAGARAAFTEAMRLDPHDAAAEFNLGLAEYRAGDDAAAESALRRFLEREPGDAEGHCNLGNALRRQGRVTEAETAYREATRLDPGAAAAWRHLGSLLVESGRAEESVTVLRRAAVVAPRDASIANGLGNALREAGDVQGAIEAFRRAGDLAPVEAAYPLNLAGTLLSIGQVDAALEACRRALAIAPDSEVALARAVAVLGRIESLPGATWLDPLLERCFAHSNLDHQSLASVAAHRVCERLGRATEGPGLPAAMAGNPILLGLLARAVNVDPDLERLIIRARGVLLEQHAGSGPLPEDRLSLVVALGLQAFANEHVLTCTSAERSVVESLVERVAGAVVDPPPEFESWLALAAMFRPLARLPCAGRLETVPAARWSQVLRPLVERALHEPLVERRSVAEIESVSPVRDETSRRVAEQYEHSPYPRWTSIPVGRPGSVPATLRGLFPGLDPAASPPAACRVLVAGCGTGQEPIALARQWPDAAITALDLSRASLAYATRMARRFGATRVRFVQGDLLEINAWAECFDVVVSVGVLHHLADPLAGWRVLAGCLRPGGLMKVGLYSERGRASVAAARRLIAAEGNDDGDESVRRFRARVLDGSAGDDLADLVRSVDFYTLSTCRDLLFHVMEHRFTLPAIASALPGLGLEPVGIEAPPECRVEAAARGEALPAADDWAGWEALEVARPSTFEGMYRLWCRRPTATATG